MRAFLCLFGIVFLLGLGLGACGDDDFGTTPDKGVTVDGGTD